MPFRASAIFAEAGEVVARFVFEPEMLAVNIQRDWAVSNAIL